MATSLSAQLSKIAAKSTHQLDLRKQRFGHSKSLIFKPEIAVSQDFDTVYTICYEGFRELCQLDKRFIDFERTLFSEQSKAEERTEMTSAQNSELDNVLESFLALVGGKLLLSPAVKAVEWLVRRFRIHEYNTSFVLFTFLPYHDIPIFLNLLAILPDTLAPTFKGLQPYKQDAISLPRRAIVHTAIKNQVFNHEFNRYVVQVARQHGAYHGLIAFWAVIATEALRGILDNVRSGRRGVENRKQEDEFNKLLPTLNDGLSLKNVPELVVGCYMLIVVFATKTQLEPHVLDTLMEAVVDSWTPESTLSGLVCVSVLAQRKDKIGLPRRVFRAILKLENIFDFLKEATDQYQSTHLLLGLISGCVNGLQKQNNTHYLDFLRRAFEEKLVDDFAAHGAISLILQSAGDSSETRDRPYETQLQLSDLVLSLNSSDFYRPFLQEATKESDLDMSNVEHALQLVLKNDDSPLPTEDINMKDTDKESQGDIFDQLIVDLAKEKPCKNSFLADLNIRDFDKLVRAFALAIGSKEKLQTVSNLPIFAKSETATMPIYISFLVRVFVGPHAVSLRITALNLATSTLSADTFPATDLQVLLPYAIFALCDNFERIRREAANLLVAISAMQKKASKTESIKPWDYNSFFLTTSSKTQIQWLSVRDSQRILERVFIPNLEESIVDSDHTRTTIVNALRGNLSTKQAPEPDIPDLKKSLRATFFSFLCSQAIHTPLYMLKYRLLHVVNGVDKVGSITRTNELKSLFHEWGSFGEHKVGIICEKENLDASVMDAEVAKIVTHKDRTSPNILLSIVTDASESTRPSFIASIFNRLETIWRKLDDKQKFEVANQLFAIAFDISSQPAAANAKNGLRNLNLPGEVLVGLIKIIPESITEIDSHAPSPKRRRTTNSSTVVTRSLDQEVLSFVIDKATFILELVDSSDPGSHIELLDGLFKVLAALHHLKPQIQSGLGYLLGLTLSSLLAIVNQAKAAKPNQFDSSAIRTDLVVDCVRTTESPQVQNTALLLIAGLATLSPEVVLHSVMPIFTFMGSSVLRKSDEYSVHVIDQTIDQVVPALVQSLRNQKRDVVAGTSELLLSFTATFEHIPSQRRQRLFETLVTKLGAHDFLFAVLAMLASRYGPGQSGKEVLSLMTSLTFTANAELQLITYKKYLNLIEDALKPKPGISQVLLGIGNEGAREPSETAETLLRSLAYILQHSGLGPQIAPVLAEDGEKPTIIRTLFSQNLQHIVTLAGTFTKNKRLSSACGDVVTAMLEALSLRDFLDTVTELLKLPDDDLRRKILRLLGVRLGPNAERDTVSRNAVFEFIPVLIGIIQNSNDVLLKHAAISCVDSISEAYGRKEPEKIADVAQVIASDSCLGQSDDRLRIMGVLCLASMVEVIGQAIIRALPNTLRRSSEILDISLQKGEENEELHNAVLSLYSALFVQLPFMLSDKDLDKILLSCSRSALSNLSQEGHEARRAILKLFGRKIDAKESFGAIERSWPNAVQCGAGATKETLELLKLAIEKHTKSATVSNVNILFQFFAKAFDLRREMAVNVNSDSKFSEMDVDGIETLTNDAAIKMIYKLNDTSFRPIFTKFVDWATNGLPKKDITGNLLRRTAFYRFLETFFGTLKSIVTSYSSYIMDDVIEVLRQAKPSDKDSRGLWLAAMRMLRLAFEHDQDEFWQSPSHMTAISTPLVYQLSYATSTYTLNTITSEAIPTITELAVTADSPDNHKDLNTAIMKYLRPTTSSLLGGSSDSHGNEGFLISGENPHTRLAAVKLERSLTDRLGEEWLALLPEMLPYISELMEDEDENVELEARLWVKQIEEVLGESLDDMLM